MADGSGILPRMSLELMALKASGRENIGITLTDYNNYLQSKHTWQVRSGETGGALEYLQRMEAKNPNFYYAIQVDEADLITNIFWADGKMRIDYEHFSDVVSFDTSYRKNEENRPFALFVGVNHHKQMIIFGTCFVKEKWALVYGQNMFCDDMTITQ